MPLYCATNMPINQSAILFPHPYLELFDNSITLATVSRQLEGIGFAREGLVADFRLLPNFEHSAVPY